MESPLNDTKILHGTKIVNECTILALEYIAITKILTTEKTLALPVTPDFMTKEPTRDIGDDLKRG